LEHERQVTTMEGQELARNFSCPFLETSAKSRVNVEESFYQLVREIRKELKGDQYAQSQKGKKKGGKNCTVL